MKPLIVAHNPNWAIGFNKVKNDLSNILRDVPILSIEHVGSTSIPGLVAKPTLDIDIVVTPDILQQARTSLITAGYTDIGEMGIPGRFLFRQPGYERVKTVLNGRDGSQDPMINEMKRNTYVILEGSLALKNHRDLKRTLLANEEMRNVYGEVKEKIVASGAKDVNEYCMKKTQVVMEILKKAGWNEEELEHVRRDNE